MLQALGLVVNLIPRHAKDLSQHALNQVMSKDGSFGNLPTCRRQLNAAVALYDDQTILLQAFQRSSHSRPCDREPMGERGGDYGLAFRFSFCDSLQIVLFRDRDHRCGENSDKCEQSNTSDVPYQSGLLAQNLLRFSRVVLFAVNIGMIF